MSQRPPSTRVEVSPTRPQFHEPVAVTVRGLDPRAPTAIRARTTLDGARWRSWARFETRADGTVDTAAQAPVAGTYEGADPSGLLWSMRRIGSASADRDAPVYASNLELTVDQRGQTLTTSRVRRPVASPDDVRRTSVDDDGVVARLYEPAAAGPHPTVLLLGGSEGGFPDRKRATLLAARGYAVVALAYFGVEGLPSSLECVSLSYFERAIDWIRRRDGLRSDEIAAIGASRGGELALLLGARHDAVRTVVGYAPSPYLYQGLASRGPSSDGAWCEDGEALPYVPHDAGAQFLLRLAWAAIRGEPVSVRPVYERGLADVDPERLAAATVPIEEIGGRVLLVSGGSDAVWPAGRHCRDAVARLESACCEFRYEHLHFPDAGHRFVVPGAPAPATSSVRVAPRVRLATGGTPAATDAASRAAWERTLEFLDDGLRRS